MGISQDNITIVQDMVQDQRQRRQKKYKKCYRNRLGYPSILN